MLPQLPPPPPPDLFGVVCIDIDSLAAALVKLNIKVPIEDLLRAIQDEDEVKYAKEAAEAAQVSPAQRRAVMSGRKSTTNSLPAL